MGSFLGRYSMTAQKRHESQVIVKLYDNLPGFVPVETPCTSDKMTGHVNTCQMIGICGHHLFYMTACT